MEIMKEVLDIIACFPSECIAIVIGVIGSILVIVGIKRDAERKENENEDLNQKNPENQNKNGVSHLYSLILFMAITCVSILRIAYHRRKLEPPETIPQSSIASQYTEPGTDVNTEPSEPTETFPKTISELQKSDFAYVAASSTYDGDRATHIATNLIDGKRETNWTEGVDGNGIGEYVHFEFQEKQTITGFRICSGNHSSDSYYAKNARPKEIKLTFEDGSSEQFTLLDVKEELTFQLSEAITTKNVRLTIQSVYEGSSWEDTVISEIVFLAAK